MSLTQASLEDLLVEQEELFDSLQRNVPTMQKLIKNPVAANISKLAARLDYIESIWPRCAELQVSLKQQSTSDERRDLSYFKDKLFATMEDIYLDIVGDSKSIIHGPPGPSTQTMPATSGEATRSSFRVPSINLPRFSGAYKDWVTFSDYFKSLILNDNNLDNLQKLHYLKSCLDGEAANLLSNVPVTAANFQVSWKKLESRYSNERCILNIHLTNLFAIKAVSNSSPVNLRKLIDSATDSVEAIKNLGRPTDQWDDIIIFLITQRLDKQSREAWELFLEDTDDFPTFSDISKFLNKRIRALEAATVLSEKPPTQSTKQTKIQSHHSEVSPPRCLVCSETHAIYRCKDFIAKSIKDRLDIVKENKLCHNCLTAFHRGKACSSKVRCSSCKKMHHTLLHFKTRFEATERREELPPTGPVIKSEPEGSESVNNSLVAASHLSNGLQQSHRLLTTAWVVIYSTSQRAFTVRALLDQGSTHTFVSKKLANALSSKTHPVSAEVSFLGGESSKNINRLIPITVRATRYNETVLSTDALILDSLTSYVPKSYVSISDCDHLRGLNFADERPMDDTPIHAVIGVDLFPYALLEGVRKGKPEEPVAQNTIFGWILSGHTKPCFSSETVVQVHHVQAVTDLDRSLRQFWEVEEGPSFQPPSEEDVRCDMHFRETFSRKSDGRYVVRLPLKNSPPLDLGDTRFRSQKVLYSIERRLAQNSDERESYYSFLREYQLLGHMRLVEPSDNEPVQSVYFPHHPVVKTTSTTTKTRVVFNASSPSSNKKSLNDHLLVGPKLQIDLSMLLTRWRVHRYVYCADIEKMFRQILVDERDIDFQRILWRDTPSEKVREYQLLTVTYGTACAPFLAMRVLKQLVLDEGCNFPLASSVIQDKIYVDDCLFGADSILLAKQIRDELLVLLRRGGFELRKWASNSTELLKDIDIRNHGLACDKSLQPDESLKILGISWNPASDTYRFLVSSEEVSTISKRVVLSIISRLFDPLGWLSPILVVAKIFMQSLWRRQLDWDTPLPVDLSDNWDEYYRSLILLEKIQIPRWIGIGSDTVIGELHGFSDASTAAYAAVVYVRILSNSESIQVHLLASKTKVAPEKQLSIPRLELCGAVLLARLMKQLHSLPELQSFQQFCWTDSTIVQAWLKLSSSHWKTFVANRVSEIHTLVPDIIWRHVSGEENPADLASRGLKPVDILQNSLWWNGPFWLSLDPQEWPSEEPPVPEDLPLEQKVSRVTTLTSVVDSAAYLNIANRFSSWLRLLRVTAIILRWLPSRKGNQNPTGTLTISAEEIRLASLRWISLLQSHHFSDEIKLLSKNKPHPNGFRTLNSDQTLKRDSQLRRLNPILDSNGLLRVGGRLSLSKLDSLAKFPYILKGGSVSRLIIRSTHQLCLHGGIALTLSNLRDSFWILQARKMIKSVIFHCMTCARIRAEMPVQLMSSLPSSRIECPGYPFLECGIDYAGPIAVRMSGGRGIRSRPAWIAVFICLATKAVHLEVVSDYSTSAFLAAFDRFCSRRNKPSIMHSDKGTNFQGADKELRRVFREVTSDSELHAKLANDGIVWKFIPPAAPHFGGLWEAGVKSMKHHLIRVLGTHTPTFEELCTLVCRIEACMNSRPISPINDDVESLDTLTPGHFLVHRNLTSVVRPSFNDVPVNRLTRWQLMSQLLEQFWRNWSDDYVRSCQHRTKWQTKTKLLQVGQIVLLRNENLPPTKWNLGRITRCHPGSDGLIRVVSVRTAVSEYLRPITKLALLPIIIESSEKDSNT